MPPVRAARLALILALAAAPAAADPPRPVPRPVPPPSMLPVAPETSLRPASRDPDLPRARWEYLQHGELWTRVALSAIHGHGQALLRTVPRDIGDWCPAYPGDDAEARAAFWAALLSTLARYESTWNPRAVGGGGLWYGLLQILPQTADFRDCRATTGEGLQRAAANLNCAVRIMAITVPRDGAIALEEGRWKGVAADWGPIRTPWMRRDMQRYTRRQPYCRPLASVRPRARPGD